MMAASIMGFGSKEKGQALDHFTMLMVMYFRATGVMIKSMARSFISSLFLVTIIYIHHAKFLVPSAG